MRAGLTHLADAVRVGVFALAFAVPSPAAAQAELTVQNCLSHPYDTPETPHQTLVRDLMSALELTLAGVPEMNAALAQHQPAICIDPRPITARGYLDPTTMQIALAEALDFDAMLLILIHELRHLEQFDHGHCPANDVSMKENARASMATEADAMAITALLAWDLRTLGRSGPWDHFAAWQEYQDIPARFEQALTDTGSLSAAVSATFDQWYASDWRVEAYYQASCSDYLDRLDLSHALPRYGLLPEDFLGTLCRLPSGAPYDCTEGPPR
ncbi:DUF6782 family putative metallopeptidase [Aliiroseovarius subalbicans]|uniref:DUF6782 family putative metallopeptidase n=1 Tax=Aliiroseovarius subalbicans TaxID=2925840 RepID=UPI001F560128|nr:DUF6782 family putative metallopeptidase [Aliiroseovarius subalbicans]MCI2399203.1 hypothetical protein [Aliiroseovarius subalbicans]